MESGKEEEVEVVILKNAQFNYNKRILVEV